MLVSILTNSITLFKILENHIFFEILRYYADKFIIFAGVMFS